MLIEIEFNDQFDEGLTYCYWSKDFPEIQPRVGEILDITTFSSFLTPGRRGYPDPSEEFASVEDLGGDDIVIKEVCYWYDKKFNMLCTKIYGEIL
jgi:hypothetical protein